MTVAYNIDCMEFMRTLPDNAFDLAVVDPPYGINADKFGNGDGLAGRGKSVSVKLRKERLNHGCGKLRGRVLNSSDCSWDSTPPPQEYFDELRRVSRNQIIWGGNYFPLPPTRGIIVWDKEQVWENFSQVELAWTSFDRTASLFRYCNAGNRGKPQESRKIHPTQKPVALYRWIYQKYANPGDKILDTHLGSGSSRIAAYDAGLDFTGCEIDPLYFRLQEERYAAHIAQQSLFIDDSMEQIEMEDL